MSKIPKTPMTITPDEWAKREGEMRVAIEQERKVVNECPTLADAIAAQRRVGVMETVLHHFRSGYSEIVA